MNAVAITDAALVTSLGNDMPSTCAAIRCAIDNAVETHFMDAAGEWLVGAEANIGANTTGAERLIALTIATIGECQARHPDVELAKTPLIVCLPDKQRPGRPVRDDDAYLDELQRALGVRLASGSRQLTHGHVAVAVALRDAQQLLAETDASHVLIVSADSLLNAVSLRHYERADRLLTSENSNGFIPGEAGACLLVERSRQQAPALHCRGLGFAREHATIDAELPLRGEGLAKALQLALEDAGMAMHDMAYRMTDVSGEQYHFKEASLALSRTLRQRLEAFDILHPADCVGETGTSLGLVTLAYQYYLFQVDPPVAGAVIAHFGDDDGKRAAIVLTSTGN